MVEIGFFVVGFERGGEVWGVGPGAGGGHVGVGGGAVRVGVETACGVSWSGEARVEGLAARGRPAAVRDRAVVGVGGEGGIGEMIRVVLSGVVGIGIYAETSVDNGRWGVYVDFANASAARRTTAFSGLDAHVPDWSIELGAHKFSVVFVHDLAVDQG